MFLPKQPRIYRLSPYSVPSFWKNSFSRSCSGSAFRFRLKTQCSNYIKQSYTNDKQNEESSTVPCAISNHLKRYITSNQALHSLLDEYSVLKERLQQLEKNKVHMDRSSRVRLSFKSHVVTFLLSAQMGMFFRLTFFDLGWDTVEPISYFFTYFAAVGGLWFYLLHGKDYTYHGLMKVQSAKEKGRKYYSSKFPINEYYQLLDQCIRYESLIREECLLTHGKIPPEIERELLKHPLMEF